MVSTGVGHASRRKRAKVGGKRAKVGGGAPLLRSQVRVTVLALAEGSLLIDDGVLIAEVGDGEGPHLW